jgi:hypothetical protein
MKEQVQRYRVILQVEIDGRLYQCGDIVELDIETAVEHAVALTRLEEQER